MKKLRLLQYAAWLCLLLPLPTLAEVKLPDGQWTERHVDLKVKVLGGFVQIDRQWINNRWYLNPAWADLRFIADPLDQSVKAVDRAGVLYERMAFGGAGGGSVYVYDNSVFIRSDGNGWRWYDRFGNWITYDQKGRITAYGDRNDIKVTFERDGGGHLATVKDHNGEVALTLQWEGERISSVTDRAQRRVQYRYEGSRLTQVIDVLNYTWQWGYDSNGQITSRTDPELRTTTVTYAESTPAAPASLGFGFAPNSAATGSGSVTTGYTPRDVKLARVQKVTDAAKQETSYSYDYDRVKRQFSIEITNPEQHKTTETYDLTGRLLIKDVGTRTVLQQSFDKSRHVSWDERGNATTTYLDASDNPIKVVYADGATVSMQYDPVFQQLLEYTDELGIKTKYQYDSKGNLVRRDEAFGLSEQRTTIYTYSTLGQLTSTTINGFPAEGDATTAYAYDKYGNIQTITDSEKYVVELVYNVIGEVISRKDPRSYTWVTNRNAAGWVVAELDPNGRAIRYEYNKVGERTEVRDERDGVGNAARTTYKFDAKGRMRGFTASNGGVTQFEYSNDGRIVRRIDPDGAVRENHLDLEGRITKLIDEKGVTDYQYGSAGDGADGLLVGASNGQALTNYRYDIRGRRTQKLRKLGAEQLGTRLRYNALGNIVERVDEAERSTKIDLDALQRRIRVTDSGNYVTAYRFDVRNNVVEVIDPEHHTTSYQYDKNDRLILEKKPGGEETKFKYDGNGNVVERINAKGQRQVFQYDPANRKVEDAYYDENGILTRRTSYAYDGFGQKTSYHDERFAPLATILSRADYRYDLDGRKVEEIIDFGPFKKTVQHSYTPGGRLKERIYPDGSKVSYHYQNGLWNQVSLPNGEVLTLEYDRGQLKQLAGMGVVQDREYDELDRSQVLRVRQGNLPEPAGTVLLSRRLIFDRTGNINERQTEHGTYRYTHDAIDRLTAVIPPAGTALPIESYTYDGVHNRKTSLHQPGDWLYGKNGELKQWSDSQQTILLDYDAIGNVVRERRGSQIMSYRYDDAERLAEVSIDGTAIGSYRYDPNGQRIYKESSKETLYFLYGEGGLLAEYDSQGNTIRQYGWQPATQLNTAPLYFQRNVGQERKIYLYKNDHLGTPQLLTDQSGVPVWTAKAEAFGKFILDDSNKFEQPLRLPGQRFDSELVRHHNYFRNFDPEMGRYIESDPIGLRGGINRYVYATQSPIRRIDALGLEDSQDTDKITICDPGGSGICWEESRDPCFTKVQETAGHEVDNLRGRRPDLKLHGTDNSQNTNYNAVLHCYGACRLYRECGALEARIALYGHEYIEKPYRQPYIRHPFVVDPVGTYNDLINNFWGEACANKAKCDKKSAQTSKQDCEGCCVDLLQKGRLRYSY